MTPLTLKEQIHEELRDSAGLSRDISQKRGWGLAHLGNPHRLILLEFFVQSLQTYLDYYVRLKLAERFCESESQVQLLQSGVWYCLTEFLQTGWLTRWV